MVDYSKWDAFTADSSDSDSEEKLVVTKLDDDSKVTIGPSGVSINNGMISKADLSNEKRIVSPLPIHQNKFSNGGTADLFEWTQDRYEVQLCALIPRDARASQVRLAYCDESRLLEFFLDEKKILGGTLRFPIDGKADDIDWEITRKSSNNTEDKFLLITLRKKSIIAGATIWWSCVFIGDPEIDVSAIPERENTNVHLWSQAHEMFKEAIKTKEMIEIDTSASDTSAASNDA